MQILLLSCILQMKVALMSLLSAEFIQEKKSHLAMAIRSFQYLKNQVVLQPSNLIVNYLIKRLLS